MSAINLRSVLIDPQRSRIIKSINQRTGTETVYPARKSVRRLGLACMGAAGVSVLAIVAAWVIHV